EDRGGVALANDARMAGFRLPDPHGPVLASRGGPGAVGAERHGPNGASVLAKCEGFGPRGWLPEENGAVLARDCQAPAVRANSHTQEGSRGPRRQVMKHLAGAHVPDLHGAFLTG